MASSAIGKLGLQGMLEVLDSRLHMAFPGRRTALPRHQTLQGLLDWSYDLLTRTEQMVLERLSVFVGAFSLDAAQAVANDAKVDDSGVVEAIFSLVSKTLVATSTVHGSPRFRLLDTTRAYAFNKLVQSNDHAATAIRHRRHFARRLEIANLSTLPLAQAANNTVRADDLGDIRAALTWSFSAARDASEGLALAAASTGLFIQLSLLVECGEWTEKALGELDEATAGTTIEMQLQAGAGIASMFVKGNTQEAQDALTRGLALASSLDQPYYQLQLLGIITIFYCRLCDYADALKIAKQSRQIAERLNTPIARSVSAGMIGTAYHLAGDQAASQASFDSALIEPFALRQGETLRVGYDHRLRDLIFLARTNWLRGNPKTGAELAMQALDEAAHLDHSVSTCITLVYGAPLFIWSGDTDVAAPLVDRLIDHAGKHSLRPYVAAGLGLKGQLAVLDGRPGEGLGLLRRAIVTLEMERYHILASVFFGAVATALTAIGQIDDAVEMIARALQRRSRNQDAPVSNSIFTAELLRIKGEILKSCQRSDASAVTECLRKAIDVAQTQSALGWELRATLSLHDHRLGMPDEIDLRQRLKVLCERFEPGSRTNDLVVARRILGS
ncbi:ATP-binding protein [Rhizobium leguminosarum]|uniref:ATP-binding protein n=1 Tax=Rhizobium TaxID=379 RepID=UPI001FE2302E|nr:hypothetical protein [Rhizobium leguminosarum]